MTEGEAFVIDAHQVQDGRVQVVDVDDVLDPLAFAISSR